jgi:hypothetical protein
LDKAFNTANIIQTMQPSKKAFTMRRLTSRYVAFTDKRVTQYHNPKLDSKQQHPGKAKPKVDCHSS